MRWLPACIILTIVLAGCTDDASAPDTTDDGTFAGFDNEVSAGKGLIRGVVVDETITPLAEATLTLCDSDTTTTSNGDGAFVFNDLEPGATCVEASKPGYESARQTTQVQADVAQPPVLRIQLVSAPGTEPRAITYGQKAFLECNIGEPTDDHDCSAAQDDRNQMRFLVDERPDWIQVELKWESTQPAGSNLYVILELCDGCNPSTFDNVESHPGRWEETGDATSVFVSRATPDDIEAAWNVTEGHEVLIDVSAGDAEGFPGGAALNQEVYGYVTLFYNIDEPVADWTFTGDGEYPLPA